MKPNLSRIAALLAAALAACSGCSEPDAPSVVLVTIDTLRADAIGVYGRERETPTLDRLAHEGTFFLQATAQSPLTLPSHASILTGTLPPYHGVKDNGSYRLPEAIDTLAEILKRAGYETAAFVGALPVHSQFGLSQGFDVYDDVPAGERRAEEVVAKARDWIERERSAPFFLWVHVFDPHSPYSPPEPLLDAYGETYEGEVAYVDRALASLFEALGRSTITVVTADHGEGLGEHGEETHALFVYDSTLHVPLLFRGPGVPPGVEVREQARSIDIVPSILELVGKGDACEACQGRSLVPAMRGEAAEAPASYAETYFPRLNLGWSELKSVRDHGWKYIAAPEPELYHVEADPGELTNLAPKEPDKAAAMAALLAGLEAEAKGPFDASPSRPDAKTLAGLRSLGYVSAESAPASEGPLPDPKAKVDVWRRLIEAKDRSDRGDVEGAIRTLGAILRDDPEIPVAHYYLAEAHYRLGRYDAARDDCEKLLEIAPAHAGASLLLAESLFRLGRVDAAAEAYQRAARADATSPRPWIRLANLWLETGEREKAREALDRADARDANDPLGEYVRGKLYLAEGRVEEAERAIRASVASDPQEVGARVHLANLLTQQRRFEEAESVLRAGLELLGPEVSLELTLGRVLAMSGRPQLAIGAFEEALHLQPSSPMILTSLGLAHLQNHDDEKGLELLSRSLELEPNQPQIRSLLEQRRNP